MEKWYWANRSSHLGIHKQTNACWRLDSLASITKPPLLQRSRLTGSGNPLFESCVEGKAQQRDIQVYSRSTYQIPHGCTFLKRHS